MAAAGLSPRAGAAGGWNPGLSVPTSRVPHRSLLISGVVMGGAATSARRRPFSQGLLSSPAKVDVGPAAGLQGPARSACSHGGSSPGRAARCVLRAPRRRFCQAYLAPGDPSDRSLFEGALEVFVQRFQPHRVHGRELPWPWSPGAEQKGMSLYPASWLRPARSHAAPRGPGAWCRGCRPPSLSSCHEPQRLPVGKLSLRTRGLACASARVCACACTNTQTQQERTGRGGGQPREGDPELRPQPAPLSR